MATGFVEEKLKLNGFLVGGIPIPPLKNISQLG